MLKTVIFPFSFLIFEAFDPLSGLPIHRGLEVWLILIGGAVTHTGFLDLTVSQRRCQQRKAKRHQEYIERPL